MWHDLAKALRELLTVNDGSPGAYRRDLHYMRGPGPKWHAKHAGFVAAPPPTQPTPPVQHDIAEHRA
jgi:hypothetical protein